jgi:hypothetical protein
MTTSVYVEAQVPPIADAIDYRDLIEAALVNRGWPQAHSKGTTFALSENEHQVADLSFDIDDSIEFEKDLAVIAQFAVIKWSSNSV